MGVIQDCCPEKTTNPVSSLALKLVSEHSYWGKGNLLVATSHPEDTFSAVLCT